MSADRELLELAAKAAGIYGFFVDAGLNAGSNAFPKVWNPLTDDGDALRLAVKLQIDVTQGGDHVVAWFDGAYIGTGHIPYEGDPCKATRRAIVRAAAELGKDQP